MTCAFCAVMTLTPVFLCVCSALSLLVEPLLKILGVGRWYADDLVRSAPPHSVDPTFRYARHANASAQAALDRATTLR